MKSIFAVTLLLVGIYCISCEKDSSFVDEYTYHEDIAPLMTTCSNGYCHSVGNFPPPLSNYTEVVHMVSLGRVIPAIKHEAGFSPMPKSGEKWSTEDINQFESWVTNGMPE